MLTTVELSNIPRRFSELQPELLSCFSETSKLNPIRLINSNLDAIRNDLLSRQLLKKRVPAHCMSWLLAEQAIPGIDNYYDNSIVCKSFGRWKHNRQLMREVLVHENAQLELLSSGFRSISCNGELLTEASSLVGTWSSLFSDSRMSPTIEVPNLIVIQDHYGHCPIANYAHLLYDALPRLAAIASHLGGEIGEWFIVSKTKNELFSRFCHFIGVPMDQQLYQTLTSEVIVHSQRQIISTCSTIHYRDPRRFKQDLFWSKTLCDAFAFSSITDRANAGDFKSNGIPNATHVYFIDRGRGARRDIVNKVALWQAISSEYTMSIFDPGSLPFEEQYLHFRSSRIVVSPHGAQLSNILFMQPESIVVEIFPSHSGYSLNFMRRAEGLGLRYFFFQDALRNSLTMPRPTRLSGETRSQAVDEFCVDVDAFMLFFSTIYKDF